MAIYNETELSAATNPIEQAIAINNLSGNMLSITVLSVLYVLLFVALKQVDSKATAFTTSFIMLIIGFVALALKLSNETILGVQLGIFIISLIFTVWRRE